MGEKKGEIPLGCECLIISFRDAYKHSHKEAVKGHARFPQPGGMLLKAACPLAFVAALNRQILMLSV